MIAKPDLLKLAHNRLKDCDVLLDNRRYAAAIYLAGYSVELVLKYRISRVFRFNNGFPENVAEFNTYVSRTRGLLKASIKDIREIRHHDLPKLLFYSGEELHITGSHATEWAEVVLWNPEKRYSSVIIRKAEAERFIDAVKVITKALF